MDGEQRWMDEVAVSGSVPLTRTLRGLVLLTEGSSSLSVKSKLSPRLVTPVTVVPIARSSTVSCQAVAG